jgi:hypothetical protein
VDIHAASRVFLLLSDQPRTGVLVTRRSVASLMVAALLLTACSGGDASETVEETPVEEAPVEQPEPEPDPEPEPEPEPEPAPAEGFPIDQPVTDPSVIDEEYVERVLQAMEDAFGWLVQDSVAAGEVTPTARFALNALYTPERAAEVAELIALTIDEGEFRPEPLPMQIELTEIRSASVDCITAVYKRDWEPMFTGPIAPSGALWIAGMRQVGTGTERHGVTVWAVFDQGWSDSPSSEVDPCV